MESTRTHHGTRGRVALLALLALAVVAFLGVVAQPAAAYNQYQHGGATCSSCHNPDPTNASCTQSGCHSNATTPSTTPYKARGGRTCWTCHTPGQSMAAVQVDPGCGNAAAGCHTTAASASHVGSNLKGCTTCHGVALSFNNPDGSAHHNTVAYSAPTCTDCHKAGGPAVAPHPAYAVETCGTCHVGVTPTHPTAASMLSPTLTVGADPLAIVAAGGTTVVSGTLMNGVTPIAGATLLLQAAATGTTTFTQVGTTTTTAADGSYAFPAAVPNGNTTYRVIARGITVATTTFRPVKGTVDVTAPASSVKPALTIALSKTAILLGKKITVKGTVKPTHAVKVAFQKKTASGSWKTLTTKTATLTVGATSTTYALAYKPLKKGTYRAHATSPASTGFLKSVTVWKTFKVK